jgi:hypothetical protein
MGIIGKIFGKSKPSVIKRVMDHPEDYELVARIEGEEIAIKIREKNMSHNEETNKEETKMKKAKTYIKEWYEEYRDDIRSNMAIIVPIVAAYTPVIIGATVISAIIGKSKK